MDTNNNREIINPNNMQNAVPENQIYEYSDFNPDTSGYYAPQPNANNNNSMMYMPPDPPIIPAIGSSPSMPATPTPSTQRHIMPAANCYGKQSEKYAPQIKQFINSEYRDYLYYNILSQKSPKASAKRILSNISADEFRHSKKWGTAYFLITGERYIPSRANIEPVVVPTSYAQALRQRYLDETSDVLKYKNFAASVYNDQCLKKLATDISDDELQHANLILDIMHSM
jgi:rubrerythrin